MKQLFAKLLLLTALPCAAQNPLWFQTSFTTNSAVTPTFSPVAGSYVGAQSVTLATSTSGCTSYLVWNTTGATSGGNLTSTSSTNPLTVAASNTVYAQVQGCPGYNNSSIGNAGYTITSGFITGSFVACTTASSNTTTCSVTCGSGGTDFLWYGGFDTNHNYTGIGVTLDGVSQTLDSTNFLGSTAPSGAWGYGHVKNCSSGSHSLVLTATGTTGIGTATMVTGRFAGVINGVLDHAGTWVSSASGTTTTCSTSSTTGDLLIDLMGSNSGGTFNGTGLTTGFTHAPTGANLYSMDYNLSASGSTSTVQQTNISGATNCGLAAYN